jgi:fluoride exporter
VNMLFIAIGGMLGAVMRFWTGMILFSHVTGFPWPTLLVNLAGCFLLGWFVEFGAKQLSDKKLTLGFQTGFIGSFTTFSTFSVELVLFVEQGDLLVAVLYFSVSLFAGLGAVAAGMKTGSMVEGKVGAK